MKSGATLVTFIAGAFGIASPIGAITHLAVNQLSKRVLLTGAQVFTLAMAFVARADSPTGGASNLAMDTLSKHVDPPRPNFLDHQEGVMDGKDQ